MPYSHVIVLAAGSVKLGKQNTVTGQFGRYLAGGAGYNGYYLPAGANHTVRFALSPKVCITASKASTRLYPATLTGLRAAVNSGPYRYYGITENRLGRITRIDQLPAESVNGEWEGTYVCLQGITGLDLLVQASATGKLSATFDFYPVASNPGVPSGSFTMSGSYAAAKVTLNPGNWLVHPPGYVTVGLSGPAPGVNTFTGKVHGPDCTTFSLHRLSARPDEAAASGKWKGTYVCAQGITGLTLAIHAGSVVHTLHTLTASFDFYAVPGNPGVPSGSFTMTGYYFPNGIDLEPGKWISQPPGYGMVSINASPPPAGGKKLRGIVVNCSSKFTLIKS